MEISKDKKDWIWAVVVFISIVLLFTFSVLPFYYGIVLGLFLGFFMLIKKEQKKKISDIWFLILSPIFSFIQFEMLNVNGLSVLRYPVAILLNLIFFYLIELIILLIAKNGKVAIIINISVFFVLALINSYVVEFRGYGFSYTDIHSIKTAINIASEYSYRLSEEQLISSLITLFMIRAASKNRFSIKTRKPILICLSIVLLVIYIILLSTTPFLLKIGIEPKFYYDHPNGFIVNTLGQIQVINENRTPDDYSIENVQKILDSIDTTIDNRREIIPQNIICIMNEALADLTVYEDFDIGYDPLEYIHSLKDNTISGYVYSSVYGGNTVISEYEFLSNNSAALFGSTMSPYSTFVNADSYSLAKQLNEHGYHSIFMHPYKKISYNRSYAYDVLGFNEQYYDVDLLKEYGENYWTDLGLYNIIKTKTEADDKTFIFAVTVQNHSPYSLMDDFNLELQQTKYGENANKYLSLIQESDKAFQNLIEYYSNITEPTIIVLFGDHQPKLDSSFFEIVNGLSLRETLNDGSLIAYKTPFVIWANYDIEEQEDVKVSINYLSTLMLEQTGIEKTTYQHFLTSIRDELPIITANGIIDRNGNCYKILNDLPDNLYKLAHCYQILEYNLLFDTENKQ